GIDGFKAGVRCDLVVMRGELPMNANASINLASNGAVTGKIAFGVKETIRMLDGQIVAVIDGPGPPNAEETLFTWTRPKIDQDLVTFNRTIPIDVIHSMTLPSGG